VALTGATGFIGRRMLAALGEAGFRARVLAREPGKLAGLIDASAVVHGSLDDDRALGALVEGADAVIHCAGAVRGVTRAQFDAVNVAGAARLAGHARAAGANRLLLISSLAAREPGLSPYAASKRGGETAVAEAAAGVPLFVIRPPAVYGPGDKEMLPLLKSMARGTAPVFGSPEARFSLIFVDDLAAAAVAWAGAPQPPEGLLEIHDGKPEGYGWREFAAEIEALTGRPVVLRPVPKALLNVPAALNALAGRLGLHAPMLTPGKLRELRHPDWVCRAGSADLVPGWAPRIGLRDGLQLTPGWH
jgi:nucleoside-diphosphate-sugar epimerase